MFWELSWGWESLQNQIMSDCYKVTEVILIIKTFEVKSSEEKHANFDIKCDKQNNAHFLK